MDVIVSRPVDTMIQWLDDADRAQVMTGLEKLRAWSSNGESSEDVRRLGQQEDLYVFRVNDSLRIIFRQANGSLEILELYPQQRLAEMFGHASAEVSR